MPVASRKRPLVSNNVAPPPTTASTLVLERMLDGKKQKKKSKKMVGKYQRASFSQRKVESNSSSNRWSHMSTKTSSDTVNNPFSDTTKMKSVLASQGGLSCAPGFRKPTIGDKKQKENTKLRRKTSFKSLKKPPSSSQIPGSSSSLSRSFTVTKRQKTTFSPKTVDIPSTLPLSQMEKLSAKPSSLSSKLSVSASTLSSFSSTPSALTFDTPTVSDKEKLASSKIGLRLTSTIRRPQNRNMRPIDLTRDSDDEGIILDPPKNEDLVVPEPSNTMTSKLSMPKRITSKLKFNILASTLSGLQKTNDLMDTDISIKMLPNKPASSDELPPPPPYQRYSQVVLDTQNKQEQPGSSTTPSLPITCSKKISFASSTSSISKKESHKVNNDNFVRLNMRNSAGSCRGARQKKLRHKYKERMQEQRAAYQKYAPQKVSSKSDHLYASQQTGLDPLDDYVDGVFHFSQKKSTNSNSEVPKCARHQQPCKLLTVRKNTTGNKGRKFYACSMPRGEQCEHFQWADDTVEAARAALADSGVSKFISRQVQQYVERFRTLTVPELKEEATKRSLKKMGKKKELLFRLAVWARDEIAKSCTEEETEDKLNEVEVSIPDDDDDSSCSSNSDEDSTSSEELELFSQEKETVKKMPMNPTCQIITTKDDDIRTGGFHSDDDDEEKDLMLVDSKKPSKPTTLKDTLHELFGHNSFRNGQEWAIERCLSKKRSLLVAPTGFGKSLCYALPAFLGDGICVVISPLISLIHDQLRALPPRISAATLSGSLSAAKTAAILDDILHKRIKVLFVSPERLASPSFQRLFRTTYNPSTQQRERKFPDISLLCIDEAHCVSQWAHNFRPCFLRFQSLLYLMNPQSILAITATAGPRVVSDICQTIGISNQEESIKIIQKGRDNIDVSCQFVASQEERFLMLSKILSPSSKDDKEEDKDVVNSHFGSLAKGSVIVYVWRQKDTEIVAEHLNNSPGVKGGVVVYHGGMGAGARTKSQSIFMRGKARICVATVAFGMGIDKSDVVGVIHLYLSSSPEHYQQEIGRAGRDGRPAKAIALPVLEEIPRRHSLEHSNIISKAQIKSLMLAIRNAIGTSSKCCDISLPVALPVQECVLGCDCKAETIETLLSLIQQQGGNDPLLEVVGYNYDCAMIALKKRTLKKLADKEPIAASIQAVAECLDPPVGCGSEEETQNSTRFKSSDAFQQQFLAYSLGTYSFSVVQCATDLGPSAEPRHIFAALRRLQSSNELELKLDTSDKGRIFNLKLNPRGVFFFTSEEEEFETHANDLVNVLYDRFSSSIFSGTGKVLDMSCIMEEVATCCKTSEIMENGKSTNLVRFQELVEAYFSGRLEEHELDVNKQLPPSFSKVTDEKSLESDVFSTFRDLPLLAKPAPDNAFACQFALSQVEYTALAVTKFLHGIDSPRAPLFDFRNHAMFGKWKETQFLLVLKFVEKLLSTQQREHTAQSKFK